MTINTSLLIAAPMLQDYLVDKDTGAPLDGGIVTLYIDTQRQTLKNWYYQTGIPGAYTWTALDNPMILSSVGTIQDPHGNDVIPFYYPFDENDETVSQKYYITVTSYQGVPQWTRENFPYNSSGGIGPEVTTTILNNLILNDGYYRNVAIGSSTGTIDATNVINLIISPSQHENYNILQNATNVSTEVIASTYDPINFGSSDVRFMKNAVGDADTIEFMSTSGFTLGTSPSFTQSSIPEYFLDLKCTSSPSGTATKKFVQYPIATHLQALSGQSFTYLIWFYNTGGGANNQIIIKLYSSYGSGTVDGGGNTPAFTETTLTTVNITAGPPNKTFQAVTGTGTFPDPATLTLGDGADDANYLRIYYPVEDSAQMEIGHTKPQIYLTTNVLPVNEFQSYDYVNALCNSPRTGDVRVSSNAYYYFGWLPMNNGTIGYTNSNANLRQNADVWQLYNLLWYMNQYNQGFAPLFDSSGNWRLYGDTPYADFSAGMAMGLPRALGNVLAGTTPIYPTGQEFTVNTGSSTNVLTVTNNSVFGSGTPVFLYNVGGALPTGLLSNSLYFTVLVPEASSGTNNTSLYLYSYANTSPNTSLIDYYFFIQRPNVYLASTVGNVLTATYDNGTAGVGATLTNAGAMAALVLDGITLTSADIGKRVLIKNQASDVQNGIYNVTNEGSASTNWILTRTVDADSPATLLDATYVRVDGGSTLIGNLYALNADVYIVGSSSINYVQLAFSLVSFSDNGSGTNYIKTQAWPTGFYEGQRYHTLIQQELPNPETSSAYYAGATMGNDLNFLLPSSSGMVAATGQVNNTGGNNAHYNMQPTLYQNFYIKM